MFNPQTGPATDFVRTTNENNLAGFLALFAEDAIVDDAGRILQGREAIRAWAVSDVFAVHVTYDVLNISENEGDATITAKVDGTFDRAGLPNPLIMTLQIATRDGKILKLTCRLAGK